MISVSSCPIGLVDGSFYSGECEEDSRLFKCRKSTSAETHQGRQLKTDGLDLSATCLRPYARQQGRNRLGWGSDRFGHTQVHPNTCATTNLHPRTAIPLGDVLYAKKHEKIHAGTHTRTTNLRVTVAGGGGFARFGLFGHRHFKGWLLVGMLVVVQGQAVVVVLLLQFTLCVTTRRSWSWAASQTTCQL